MKAYKRDFEAIARAFRLRVDTFRALPEGNEIRKIGEAALKVLAGDIADVLAHSNPEFKRGRFIEACGVSNV